jgi:hypothetical protein
VVDASEDRDAQQGIAPLLAEQIDPISIKFCRNMGIRPWSYPAGSDPSSKNSAKWPIERNPKKPIPYEAA